MEEFAEDMDGDGHMDISASYTGNTMAWHENDGNVGKILSWTTAEISTAFGRPTEHSGQFCSRY